MKYILLLITITLSSYLYSQKIHLFTDTLFLEPVDTFVIEKYNNSYTWILNLDDSTLTQILPSTRILDNITYEIKSNELFIYGPNFDLRVLFYHRYYFKMFAENTSFSGIYKYNDE